MDVIKDKIEEKLYQLIDERFNRFNEIKIDYRDFCFALLVNMCLFYDGNLGNCKILLVGNFY